MFLNNGSLLKLFNKVPYFFFVILVLHVPRTTRTKSSVITHQYRVVSLTLAIFEGFWSWMNSSKMCFYLTVHISKKIFSSPSPFCVFPLE
jgi:hypothetical protein